MPHPRLCLHLIAFWLLLAPPPRASAQVFQIRSVPSLPSATRVELARLGEPSWVTTGPTGETLRSILVERCGRQGPAVDPQLESQMRELNLSDDLDLYVEPGVAVAVPFCLSVDSVEVRLGDTLEKLLRERYGTFGPLTVRQTYELNKAGTDATSLEGFTRQLPIGERLYLPSLDHRLFDFRAGLDHETIASASRELQQTFATALEPVEANFELPQPPHVYSYITFVTSSAASSLPNCGIDSLPRSFDVETLKERYRIESEAAAADNDPSVRPAVVGVIDSGITDFQEPYFSPRFFSANHGEQGRTPEKDDDYNTYWDDIYGINFNGPTQNGSIRFYEADPNGKHGTQIASLVLGGPTWITALDPSIAPPVRLKVVNFTHSTLLLPVSPEQIGAAIHYLTEQNADVINMSLSNEQPLIQARLAMERNQHSLFVVAAGNDPSSGLNLAAAGVFPAGDGGRVGRFADRIVTVGAHDNSGAWARFSNYSDEYVDLLAPGCAIETVDPKGHVVRESGTSVATAIVSFAAGLIRSLGAEQRQEVKNRLLIGTDIDAGLAQRSWTSGRLNMVKAISIRNDVIETISLGHQYLFGKLRDLSELRRFCGDPKKRPRLDSLRKVRPNIARPDGPYIEYWGLRNDRTLWRDECPQIESGRSIGVVQIDEIEFQGPPLHDVRDIVLATR